MNTQSIVIGETQIPSYSIGGDSIRKISAVNAMDIVGAELSVDQLTIKVAGDVNDGKLLAPSDYDEVITSDGFTLALREGFTNLPFVPYGTQLRYSRYDALFGLYYIKNINRLSANLYQINAMSAVGLLDKQQHVGGLYTGQTFSQVVTEIIGGTIPFTIENEVQNVTIYGWLPVATKRQNLHQLLFATGAALEKDENGFVRFVFLKSDTAYEIPDNRFYLGGNVDYSSPATKVEITEHTFYALPNDETLTLFDNTDGSGAADNTFVTFSDGPVHDLVSAGNLTIVRSGVNYAVLTGTGVLTGRRYTHVTKTVSKVVEDATGEENVVTVTDATLVSIANSENVAKRVLAYYSNKKTVSASIVMDAEKPGDIISFNDPYGDPTKGFISNMEINVSTILKSRCEIVTDYVPTGQGNNYNIGTVYSVSGSFLVPDEGGLAVLIGGGTGGQSGGNGSAGGRSRGDQIGEGGDGGAAGAAGAGGKIISVKLLPGSYELTVGMGGAGGTPTGTSPRDGNPGTATVIYQNGQAIFTSDSGDSNQYGYFNRFNGVVYALPGGVGVNGGKGGKPTYANWTSGAGYNAESVTFNNRTWSGGANGNRDEFEEYDEETGSYYSLLYNGGGGGGAAVGNNGSRGGNGSDRNFYGGNGANASSRTAATIFGSGGDGGHGGGGGGPSGALAVLNVTVISEGSVGSGGAGGSGGRGGNGCLILYTNS